MLIFTDYRYDNYYHLLFIMLIDHKIRLYGRGRNRLVLTVVKTGDGCCSCTSRIKGISSESWVFHTFWIAPAKPYVNGELRNCIIACFDYNIQTKYVRNGSYNDDIIIMGYASYEIHQMPITQGHNILNLNPARNLNIWNSRTNNLKKIAHLICEWY